MTEAFRELGRYTLFGELATGGMATIHWGRQRGAAGFARTVVIKRMHPQYARDPHFVDMFVDEGRIAARVQHPNVCSTLDVVAEDGEVFVVLEYLHGEPLSRLLQRLQRRGERVPLPIASAILSGMLHGLHAAHEARGEDGERLEIVHRDVSPHNVMVCRDGAVKVVDFGVAKARGQLHTTRDGSLKGKLPYMSPEQVRGEDLDRTSDVFSAAVVAWEIFANRRLFSGPNEAAILQRIMTDPIPPPSSAAPVPPEIDALILRSLSRNRSQRHPDARAMASELERSLPPASASEIADWVESVAGEELEQRARTFSSLESSARRLAPAREESSEPEDPPTRALSPAPRAPRRRARLVAIAIAAASAGVTLYAVWPADPTREARRACEHRTPAAVFCGNNTDVHPLSKSYLVACNRGAPVVRRCEGACLKFPEGYPDACDPCFDKPNGLYCASEVGLEPLLHPFLLRCGEHEGIIQQACESGCEPGAGHATCRR